MYKYEIGIGDIVMKRKSDNDDLVDSHPLPAAWWECLECHETYPIVAGDQVQYCPRCGSPRGKLVTKAEFIARTEPNFKRKSILEV